jgi:iron complex transport system ATP-binding protein
MITNKNTGIKISALQASYADHLLFSDFNFQFELGKLYGLVGNNGTGKSTFLRQLAGISKIEKNKICYQENDVSLLNAKEKANIRFYIHPQSFSDRSITMEACLEIALNNNSNLFGMISLKEKSIIHESIAYFNIEKLRRKKLSEISDGEFQKVMLCMAYTSECPFIMLDEPTAYLDFNAKKENFRLLKQMCEEKNKCIIVATHDIYQLMEATDNLLLIENKKIAATSRAELKASLSIE